VPRKYANDEERRTVVRERQRLYRATIALKRAVCNGAQHEEARYMANIAQQLLENAEQHTRMHVVETERGRQAQLMIEVMRCTEQRHIACVKDQLQVGQHMALRDLRYPLADSQIDQKVFKCLNEQCNHCGSRFWIEKRTGGFFSKTTL
jgi:hypothetical protein